VQRLAPPLQMRERVGRFAIARVVPLRVLLRVELGIERDLELGIRRRDEARGAASSIRFPSAGSSSSVACARFAIRAERAARRRSPASPARARLVVARASVKTSRSAGTRS
jgi:hypothetical protein